MIWIPALLGAVVVGVAAALARPKVGKQKLDPAPHTDDAGRVYYDVLEWDGSKWAVFGRRYLG